ncbi:MAG: GNAT family N-acetyltransferase, partial [Crocosphaera sp.]
GVKLARLAVSKNFHNLGWWSILLVECMKRANVIADNAGVVGLFVDAKTLDVKKYYQRFGFEGTEVNPLLLFLPLSTIIGLIDS